MALAVALLVWILVAVLLYIVGCRLKPEACSASRRQTAAKAAVGLPMDLTGMKTASDARRGVGAT